VHFSSVPIAFRAEIRHSVTLYISTDVSDGGVTTQLRYPAGFWHASIAGPLKRTSPISCVTSAAWPDGFGRLIG
jgi:hypothetical protein